MLKLPLILTIIISSIILSIKCYATEGKLDISADKLSIDRLNNISIFEGNVIIEFKDITLKTQKVKVIYKTPAHEKKGNTNLDKIIINNPFKAYRLVNGDTEIIEANYAEYSSVKRKLEIKDKVKLTRKDTILFCDELTYYTNMIKIYGRDISN